MKNIIWEKVIVLPFDYELYFTNCRDKLALEAGCDTSECRGISERNGSKFYIGVFDNDECTLIHELYHFITYLNEYVGSPMNSDTGEWNAYSMDYYFKTIKNKLIVKEGVLHSYD